MKDAGNWLPCPREWRKVGGYVSHGGDCNCYKQNGHKRNPESVTDKVHECACGSRPPEDRDLIG